MPGYIHIFVLERAAQDGPARSAFQVNYTEPGVTFARVCDRLHLSRLLGGTLGLDRTRIERLMAQLQSSGRATIDDVELSPQETAALGMAQLPSEN
jgi:hypothetical protein